VAVEREFGVAVPNEEVGSEAFGNVAALAAWLAPRLAPTAERAERAAPSE
jgi:hypothetical protein